MVRVSWVVLSFGLAASAWSWPVGVRGDEPAPRVVDLLADRDAWSSWSARPEIAPEFAGEGGGGPGGRPVLVISGGGKENGCGDWRRPLPPLGEGRRYLLEAAFQVEDMAAPGRSVWGLVTVNGHEFAELAFQEAREGWQRLALELEPDPKGRDLELRLCLARAPKGTVRWSDVRLIDVTDVPVKKRTARLAAVSGRPKGAASPADCMDFYCARLDEIGAGGADLACLPEWINADGIAGDDKAKWAEPIPGPSTRRLAEKARQYRMYVAASLVERDGGLVYNTGVLLDRSGALVGKYRKTHPTIDEMFSYGVTPGDDYPVFDTDFGRVGYMICYDNHFPEVARLLSLKGARVLVYSNMGDGREGGSLWEPYMRTRAMDNNVHIVAAVNQSGRSCIVNPRGEVLAMAEKGRGAIVTSECDLGISVRNYSKRGIGERYLQLRRADTFAPLAEHYWDLRHSGGGKVTGGSGRGN